MRKSTEIALMNLSKMAGGEGDLEHGKQVIFQIHHTEWLNAQTRMKELDLEERKYNFMTKPILKNVVMPPFINEPQDLSVGEFASLMQGMAVMLQMEMMGSGGQMGAMSDLAMDAWKRVQKIRDDVGKQHTKGGVTNQRKVEEHLFKLYNDPTSDYFFASETAARAFYPYFPQFDKTTGEVIPYDNLPKDMRTLPKVAAPGLFWGPRSLWWKLAAKFGFGQQVPMPPSMGPAARTSAKTEEEKAWAPSAEVEAMAQQNILE